MGIRRFLKNLHALYTNSEMSIDKQISSMQFVLHNIRQKQLLDKANIIIELFELKYPNSEFSQEIKYLKENGITLFPYQQLKRINHPIEAGVDSKIGLPYVIHNDKKLFFHKYYNIESTIDQYKNYIEEECHLGGDYKEKTPHQYQSDFCKIEQGDVLVELGAAEGLLSLDSIDKVSHAYIIEADEVWMPALKATFARYSSKVTIINKFVGDVDSENTIRLDTILKDVIDKSVYVKMDIEGAEVDVLYNSRDLLSKNNIKLACCTYHKSADYDKICSILQELGYTYETSNGYMPFFYDVDYDLNNCFRHGLVRAKRI